MNIELRNIQREIEDDIRALTPGDTPATNTIAEALLTGKIRHCRAAFGLHKFPDLSVGLLDGILVLINAFGTEGLQSILEVYCKGPLDRNKLTEILNMKADWSDWLQGYDARTRMLAELEEKCITEK